MIPFRLGVIGDPISHSLSPRIFEILKKKTGCSHLSYEKVHLTAEQFPLWIQERREKRDWLGFNVTLPYKEKVFQLFSSEGYRGGPSPFSYAQLIGAANGVTFGKISELPSTTLTSDSEDINFEDLNIDGKCFNTDVEGVQLTLFMFHPRAEQSSEVLRAPHSLKRAVVLGAGGAARGALLALANLGLEKIHIINRTESKAHELRALFAQYFPHIEWKVLSWDKGLLDDEITELLKLEPWDVFLQTTSYGLPLASSVSLGSHSASSLQSGIDQGASNGICTPQKEERLESLLRGVRRETGLVMDMVYRPLETEVLWSAKYKHQLIPINGLWMLIFQALAAWRIWFGKAYPIPHPEDHFQELCTWAREIYSEIHLDL